MTREFYFLRHGETDWNTKQLCQGQMDIPLNDAGRHQAELAGKSTSKLRIETILYSPLKRAVETAKIVGKHHPDAEMIALDALKERAWGDYEGSSSEQMYAFEEAERNADPELAHPGGNFETRVMFLKRIDRALEFVFESKETVLVVSHGRFFNGLCELLEISPVKQLENGRPMRVVCALREGQAGKSLAEPVW